MITKWFCFYDASEYRKTPIVWPPSLPCELIEDEWSFVRESLRTSTAFRWEFRMMLFIEQRGLCFWCKKPMSMEHFSVGNRIKNNDRFASFEHVTRRYDGGGFTKENIRLAHATCNRKREKNLPPNGQKYKHLIETASNGKQKNDAKSNSEVCGV